MSATAKIAAASATVAPKSKVEIVMVGDRILVETIEVVRSSIIEIPESAKEKSTKVRIVKLGQGRANRDGGFTVQLHAMPLDGRWRGQAPAINRESPAAPERSRAAAPWP